MGVVKLGEIWTDAELPEGYKRGEPTPEDKEIKALPWPRGQCKRTGKRQWLKREHAKAQQRQLERRGDLGPGEMMNVYICRHCGYWHTGHTP